MIASEESSSSPLISASMGSTVLFESGRMLSSGCETWLMINTFGLEVLLRLIPAGATSGAASGSEPGGAFGVVGAAVDVRLTCRICDVNSFALRRNARTLVVEKIFVVGVHCPGVSSTVLTIFKGSIPCSIAHPDSVYQLNVSV